CGEQPGSLGWRRHAPEQGFESVPAKGSELPLHKPDLGLGVEWGSLVGRSGRNVRHRSSVLQQLSLAAEAVRGAQPGTRLQDRQRRKSEVECPGGVPERIQSLVLFRSERRRAYEC